MGWIKKKIKQVTGSVSKAVKSITHVVDKAVSEVNRGLQKTANIVGEGVGSVAGLIPGVNGDKVSNMVSGVLATPSNAATALIKGGLESGNQLAQGKLRHATASAWGGVNDSLVTSARGTLGGAVDLLDDKNLNKAYYHQAGGDQGIANVGKVVGIAAATVFTAGAATGALATAGMGATAAGAVGTLAASTAIGMGGTYLTGDKYVGIGAQIGGLATGLSGTEIGNSLGISTIHEAGMSAGANAMSAIWTPSGSPTATATPTATSTGGESDLVWWGDPIAETAEPSSGLLGTGLDWGDVALAGMAAYAMYGQGGDAPETPAVPDLNDEYYYYSSGRTRGGLSNYVFGGAANRRASVWG